MSSWRLEAAALAAVLLFALAPALAAPPAYEGIGRTATPAEVAAWDIDVRPDFQGLPKGQGSVRRGEQVWEAQCASCHGPFGESNDVFTPLVGYTTAADVQRGRVASLVAGANTPTRTTLMKVSQLSTLWDYIRRAMPWTAPKSLSPDDVYAVTAYLLNLANVVPEDFTLSDANIREVQGRMPNRLGTTTAHALWPGNELGGTRKPDAQGSTCRSDCPVSTQVASLIPDYARNAHGNLAEQSRALGPTRGTDTAGPVAAAPATDVAPLLQKNTCTACHGVDARIVGPSFKEVARKYQGRADAEAYLAGKIRAGGQGIWGAIPMPPQTIGEAEATRVARWLAQGAGR